MDIVERLREKCAHYAEAFPGSLPMGWMPETCGCERCEAAKIIEELRQRLLQIDRP